LGGRRQNRWAVRLRRKSGSHVQAVIMTRWLAFIFDLPIAVWLLAFFIFVWVSASFLGLSTEWAQLALAVGLGAATVSSFHLAEMADKRQRVLDERQAELDARTVPSQESLNILATDMRKLREGSMRELVAELQAIREQLERVSSPQGSSDDSSSAS
jgi:hypothetical protein